MLLLILNCKEYIYLWHLAVLSDNPTPTNSLMIGFSNCLGGHQKIQKCNYKKDSSSLTKLDKISVMKTQAFQEHNQLLLLPTLDLIDIEIEIKRINKWFI